jgi:ferredoxin
MIAVNQDICLGCGACAGLCPSVFKIGASGKSEVISQENVECAKQAAAACPVKAITVS